eukprot:m.176951 g.176951  ORF g.176951 m.176951 type:complete len:77 (+) comp24469_c0_seq5:727-957(+)
MQYAEWVLICSLLGGDVCSSEGAPCSVCQAPIQPDDRVVTLGCAHPFHPDCVLPWLKQSSTCPVCRWDVNEGYSLE